MPVGESKDSHVMGYGGYGCFKRSKVERLWMVVPRDLVIGALPQYCNISNILVPQTAQDL